MNITLRRIFANKFFSIVNIMGLAIGLSTCLLVTLFVKNELSYDRWIPGGENIYKLETHYFQANSAPYITAKTPMAVNGAITREMSGVTAVSVMEWNVNVKDEEDVFDEVITFGGANFFNVFDLPMLKGNREEVFKGVNRVLLSEEMASKYFDAGQALGKTITLRVFNQENQYEVVGIFKDIPINTHFKINMFTPLNESNDVFKSVLDNWYSSVVHTYLKVNDNIDLEVFRTLLIDVVRNNVSSDYLKNENIVLNVVPLYDIHLHATKNNQRSEGGSLTTIVSLVFSGLIILVIAAINFVNLSTACATIRAKEIGVRKVLGANRHDISIQFLCESVFYTYLALILSIGLVYLALPFFNDIFQKNLSLIDIADPYLIALIFVLVTFVGIIAGSYPAFVLSNFRPVVVLRSRNNAAPGSAKFIKSLVVFQYAITVSLIIGTAFVYMQTKYMLNMNPGFSKEQKLNIFVGDNNTYTNDTISREFLSIPGVNNYAFSSHSFPRSGSSTEEAVLVGHGVTDRLVVETIAVGEGFFSMYGVEEVAGRLFPREFPGNVRLEGKEKQLGSGDIVVNEAFLRNFGINDSQVAVGLTVLLDGKFESRIIGVTPDLHLTSLRNAVPPMVFILKPAEELRILTLSLKTNSLTDALAEIDKTWKRLFPDNVLRRSFVDAEFNALYSAETKLLDVLTALSVLAIAVAVTGLFGLVTFTIERRFKEVGLRKVMGASVKDIVFLLVWQFSKPVILGCILGVLGAFLFIQDWLNGFSNKIGLIDHLYLFIFTLLVAILIAWLTALVQVTKLARENPIKALRYE